MSQYPELIAQFSSGNQTRIKQGVIAKAPLEGWHYGSKEIVKEFHIYPNSPEDGKPENILKIVKEWRRSQGLSLFKDSE